MKSYKSIAESIRSGLSDIKAEVIISDFDNQPDTSLNELLGSYELWYVDINQTVGPGETPFLQIAFD